MGLDKKVRNLFDAKKLSEGIKAYDDYQRRIKEAIMKGENETIFKLRDWFLSATKGLTAEELMVVLNYARGGISPKRETYC